MAEGKRYWRCAKIFKDALAKYRPDWTTDKLSEESGIPVSTLNACRQGARYLNEDDAIAVANCLKLPPDARTDFLNRTKQASEPERDRTLREILADPNASLRVEGLRYLPFSDENRFIDSFLKRFFQLSGIAMKPPDIVSTVLSHRTARLLDGQSHIAVNLFCTLPRLKKIDFLLFPIRLSISAVMPKRFLLRLSDVQDRVLGKTPKNNELLRLVVVEGEVGHEHAKTVAGYSDDEMEVLDKWDADQFVRRLIDLDSKCTDTDGTIPVLLCDEIISLRVLQLLANRSLGDQYTLAFPLTTTSNIRKFAKRRETPEYRLGLAVSRERTDLKEYLRESLQFYLLTDPEYLARLYATLFSDLLNYVRDSIRSQDLDFLDSSDDLSSRSIRRFRLARDFARYAFRLDREAIEGYRDQFLPWRNILRRAYQIVCVEQASNRVQIRQLLEHVLSERLGKEFKKRELKEWQLIERSIQQEFDVSIDLSKHPTKSLEGIVSAIQTALLRSASSSAQFDVPVIEAEPEHRQQVLGLFTEFIQEMTKKNFDVEPIPNSEQLTKWIAGPSPSVIILLAVLHGQFIGCVQVGPADNGAVRLTRLFVRRQWRGPDWGVSAPLVWKAIECAAERLNGASIFIRETRTPEKLTKFFQNKGFLRASNDSDMLHYPLDESALWATSITGLGGVANAAHAASLPHTVRRD